MHVFFSSCRLTGVNKESEGPRWLTGLWTITDRLRFSYLKILIMLAEGFISTWRPFLRCHEHQVHFCPKISARFIVYDNVWWWHYINGTTYFTQIFSLEYKTSNHLLAKRIIRMPISTVLFGSIMTSVNVVSFWVVFHTATLPFFNSFLQSGRWFLFL